MSADIYFFCRLLSLSPFSFWEIEFGDGIKEWFKDWCM